METTLDLGSLRLLPHCPKGHRVVGIMDGEFVVAEVHIPADTPLRETDTVVRKVISNQL